MKPAHPQLAPQDTAFAIARPYALFLGDVADRLDAKTALGLLDWRPEWCVAQVRLPGCKVETSLPDAAPEEAARLGARTLVVGVAPFGGRLPDHWVPALLAALDAGLDLASGMHDRLSARPEIAQRAAALGRRLHDVRHLPPGTALPVGSGARRSGRRLLTIGTDCAIGKKYTALALERDMRARGWNADFRATGQTGLLISGGGIAIDAVVADFIAGAAELLSPPAAADHWDLVEGQGSLFHPAYAGVSLGLLHGSQPDALVLCHDPRRTHIDGYPDFPLPAPSRCIALALDLARLTNPDARCVGVSLNSAGMAQEERARAFAELSAECGVPCIDPLITGTGAVLGEIERTFGRFGKV
jgi:uncharacterized NAD-dependent epimerase/dehydratase family protein